VRVFAVSTEVNLDMIPLWRRG